MLHPRLIPALLLVHLVFLSGCATLFKSPAERINVVGPDDVAVIMNDTLALPLGRHENGTRYIELPSDRDHRLTVRGGGRSDTLMMRRGVSPVFAMLDAGTLGLGMVVDAVTGDWMSFNGQGIVYLNDTNASYHGADIGWNALNQRDVSRYVPPRDYVTLNLFINHISFPLAEGNMMPMFFFTGFGGMVALKAERDLEIGAMAEVAHASDYFTGGSRINSLSYGGGLSATTYQVFVRRQLPGSVYAAGGLGGTYTENLVRTSTSGDRDFWVRQWVPSGSGSIGVRGSVFFGELRMLAGLLPVRVDDTHSAMVLMLTLRSGFNFEL